MLFPRQRPGQVWTSIAALRFDRESLGSGALSQVFRVEEPGTGKEFAVKVLNLRSMSLGDQLNVLRELEAYHVLQHPSIVRFHDYIIEDGVVYIVLDLLRGGSLFDYLRRNAPLPTALIRRLFRDCAEAVAYIHAQGFLLRDIKPENVLLDEELNVRLCDLGWACRADDAAACAENAGTLAYMSLEALLGLRQTARSDVWSLGILLYELFLNNEPFPGANTAEMLALQREKPSRFGRVDEMPEEAASLARRMTRLAPSNRLSLAKVLADPFLARPSAVNEGRSRCAFLAREASHPSQAAAAGRSAWLRKPGTACG